MLLRMFLGRKLTMFGNAPEGAKMFGNELERLLETLFEDDNESTPEDVTVLNSYILPFKILTACCVYSYTGY